MHKYKGDLRTGAGASASANEFEASTPITVLFARADTVQNIREPICSRELVWVSTIVTQPLLLGDPLQTHRDLRRFSCALKI